jgi:hypothetical protein
MVGYRVVAGPGSSALRVEECGLTLLVYVGALVLELDRVALAE